MPDYSKRPFDPLVRGRLTFERVTWQPSQKGHHRRIHIYIYIFGFFKLKFEIWNLYQCIPKPPLQVIPGRGPFFHRSMDLYGPSWKGSRKKEFGGTKTEHPRLLNHFEWSIHVGLMGQLETAPPLKILDASKILDPILGMYICIKI